MAFTESTSVGWLSRIFESIKGVLIGFVLIGVSVVALFWGEGRAVHRAQALAEGKANVVAVDANKVDPANEGKLVYVSAPATTEKGLDDEDFGLQAPTALRLVRKTEMYQWKQSTRTETHKNFGGSEERVTTYTYEKEWSASHIESSAFKESGHANPAKIPVAGETWNAPDAKLGAFELSGVVLDQLSAEQQVTPKSLDDAKTSELGSKKGVIAQGMIYFGKPDSPVVGDVRVSHAQLPAGPISVIAQQTNGGFEAYHAESGDLILAQTGTVSSATMFKQAEEENANITWIIRGVGFVLIWIGFGLIFSPLATIADVVPFIGSIVGAGTFIAGFICALPVWLITVAVAWIVYRPVIGILLLVVAIGIPLLFKITRKPKVAAG